MANLSTNNASIVILFEGLAAITVENFDAESDMWTTTERQTGDAEVSPDGIMNYWGMNVMAEATLNLSGGSTTAKLLRQVLNQQQRRGNKPSFMRKVSVTVNMPGELPSIYYDGIMTSGKSGGHLGNQKLQVQPFLFKFAGVK